MLEPPSIETLAGEIDPSACEGVQYRAPVHGPFDGRWDEAMRAAGRVHALLRGGADGPPSPFLPLVPAAIGLERAVTAYEALPSLANGKHLCRSARELVLAVKKGAE